METGSLFSKQVHWITREAILLNSKPFEERTDSQRSGERVTIPSRKRHLPRAAGSDLFEVSKQFHEAHLIRVTDWRFTIWLHPFGMLDSEIVMDLLSKLWVSVNVVSLRHCLGETSSVQPNGSSKATSPASTSCGAMSACQGQGLGQVAL